MMEILFPFSLLYRAGLEIDKRISRAKELSRPVISIGNITWGGTGKTPMVIKTARYLISIGLLPCVLTRGYGRKQNDTVIVSDGKDVLSSAELAGDEPRLIAESVRGSIVAAGSDRFRAAKKVLASLKPDVFILDDGFQHWALKRDLDIVCVSSSKPFGNGLLIPAGILREPVSSLKRAGLVVLTNSGISDGKESLRKKLTLEFGTEPLSAKLVPQSFTRLIDKKTMGIGELSVRSVIALSALGDNSGFKKTLEDLGFEVSRHFAFRDHHWFKKSEVLKILSSAKNGEPVVTTTKDAARLESILGSLPCEDSMKLYTLNVDLIFENGENIWQEKIKKAARFSSTVTGPSSANETICVR